jgi:hypothetical protein
MKEELKQLKRRSPEKVEGKACADNRNDLPFCLLIPSDLFSYSCVEDVKNPKRLLFLIGVEFFSYRRVLSHRRPKMGTLFNYSGSVFAP